MPAKRRAWGGSDPYGSSNEPGGPVQEHQVVTVRFLGFLASLAGSREVSVEVRKDVSVIEVLELLGERFGSRFSASIFRSPGEVQTHLRVFLDDREALTSDRIPCGGASPARIEILVLPMMAGGSR